MGVGCRVSSVTRELFSSFHESAFHLETRDRYLIEGEQEKSFQSFLRHGVLPESGPEEQSWLGKVRAWTAAGKRIQRVHVIAHPLSDYLRWELEMYRRTSQAGEDIRIADVGRHPRLRELDTDFWLFDDAMVAVLRYDVDGRLIGSELAPDPAPFRAHRDLALARAIRLDDYLAHHDPAASAGAGRR